MVPLTAVAQLATSLALSVVAFWVGWVLEVAGLTSSEQKGQCTCTGNMLAATHVLSFVA